MNETEQLMDLNKRLLDSIVVGDWQTYCELCDPTLSCFEPEANGCLVEGMDFHRFYFEMARDALKTQTTLSRPHVRLLGLDTAVVSYVRLTQRLDGSGKASTQSEIGRAHV